MQAKSTLDEIESSLKAAWKRQSGTMSFSSGGCFVADGCDVNQGVPIVGDVHSPNGAITRYPIPDP